MSFGGSGKADTADSIEARRIAIEEFNDRMRFGAPAEKFYMGEVDRMRTPGQYQRAAGVTSAAMQPELEAARTQFDAQNISRGIAPGAGAFSPAITAGFARSRALGLAESQDAQTSRYFGGAANIVGIGRGVAGQGVQGFGQLAEVSGRRAATEAKSAFETASAQRGLAGTLTGVGAGLYANYKFPQKTGGGFG